VRLVVVERKYIENLHVEWVRCIGCLVSCISIWHDTL